jgi:hypothetical protein
MSDRQGRSRRGRLTVDTEQEMITALALEAQRRGTTLAALTHLALAEWMRREMPVGEMPHGSQTPRSRDEDGR